MSDTSTSKDSPRAVIHKQILNVAESNPEASIDAIADEISGASPDLVERVLDNYGDPAEAQTPHPDAPSDPSTATSDGGQTGISDDLDQQLTTLHERIDQIEQRIDERPESLEPPESSDDSPFSDPDLAAKVVRACMADDRISEDEEITILSELLN